MKPHKHAEIIKAWADGAEIEWWCEHERKWKNEYIERPSFSPLFTYRVKTQPKPDYVRYCQIRLLDGNVYRHKDDNAVLIFDGETGELKSAEVLK